MGRILDRHVFEEESVMTHRSVRRGARALAVSLFALIALPGAALAQTASPAGPPPIQKAVALASPAVVFIDTSASIKVQLTYQKSTNISGLGHVNQAYKLDYATGSGFVVNPNGVVVTASHVVEPDQQSLQNYAANKLILEGLKYTYPNSNSSPFEQYNLPVSAANVVLHQCYKAIDCKFDITPIVTVYTASDVAQSTLPEGHAARILNSTGFEATDVAILQMEGSNLPTVPLAETANNLASGDSVVALGYPGSSTQALQTGVTVPTKVFGKVSNIRTEGTSKLVEIDANIEPGESGGPAVDSSGKVIGLVSFTLLQSSGAAGQKFLRTVDDIKTALAQSGVTAQRGPTDEAFAKGMEYFWAHHYTAAVPELQKATQLYNGFPLASDYLAQAQAKKGTAADVPLDTGSSFPWWILIVAAVVVVIIVVAVVLTRRGKRPAAQPAMVGAAAPATTSPGAATPPPPPPVATAPPPPTTPPSEPAGGRAAPWGGREQPPPGETTDAGAAPGAGAAAGTEAPAETAEHETPHFCPNCGHSVTPEEKFCPNCGHQLN
jgi:S1-C subfamily serine protease